MNKGDLVYIVFHFKIYGVGVIPALIVSIDCSIPFSVYAKVRYQSGLTESMPIECCKKSISDALKLALEKEDAR